MKQIGAQTTHTRSPNMQTDPQHFDHSALRAAAKLLSGNCYLWRCAPSGYFVRVFNPKWRRTTQFALTTTLPVYIKDYGSHDRAFNLPEGTIYSDPIV